jgi:hypothetical protein
LTLLALHSHAALGQNGGVPQWLQDAIRHRGESLAGIELIIKRSDVDIPGFQMALPGGALGLCTGSICQAIKIEPTDIPGIVIERPLSPMELGVLSGNTSADFLQAYGEGMISAQVMLNQSIGGQAGGMFGLLSQFGAVGPGIGGPMQYLNPTTMFAAGGMMMLEAARAARAAERSLAESGTLAQAEAQVLVEALSRMQESGRALVGDVNARVFSATDLGFPVQQVDGQSFEMTGATLHLDPESYAFLKQRYEGKATADGETRDFFIEVESSDFRSPPGCGDLVEPYRRTMRMGGMLDEEQMAEMEEAREQLAEFEQQLASMSARERQMMERMMGSQMATMRSLVNGGAFEYVEETEEILCNPDLSTLFSVGAEPAPSVALVKQIQEYLVILGYEPGNIEGELDVLTQVAISEFQAARDLPVTGEPSAQLASLLANLVTG